ncbi:MAG: hypothetical protein M3P41_06555, partial [Actinomycetota bacterium]|nr:hypothetical protein [Actinomycetota bacterium]
GFDLGLCFDLGLGLGLGFGLGLGLDFDLGLGLGLDLGLGLGLGLGLRGHLCVRRRHDRVRRDGRLLVVVDLAHSASGS